MMLQIVNLLNDMGQADYKTLDVNKIIQGTQIYDFTNNIGYIGYSGSYPPHQDIKDISDSEYDDIKKSLTGDTKISMEERVTSLEATINEILIGGI